MLAMGAPSRRMITPALLSGIAAAAVLLALPAGLVETIVASSGLSEVWPAAAPPLGWKARLVLAGFGALMVMGLSWAGRASVSTPLLQDYGRWHRVQGVSDMGFALSKLSWLSRGRATGSRAGRPALRRADAHPDTPARTPIFASRDFGGIDIFPRIAPAQPQSEPIEAAGQPEAVLPEALPHVEEAAFEEIAEAPAPTPVIAEPPTLADLTARLERGLARRERRTGGGQQVLADMPVEQAVPVRARVEDDVDQALRAALGTLRAMAERTR